MIDKCVQAVVHLCVHERVGQPGVRGADKPERAPEHCHQVGPGRPIPQLQAPTPVGSARCGRPEGLQECSVDGSVVFCQDSAGFIFYEAVLSYCIFAGFILFRGCAQFVSSIIFILSEAVRNFHFPPDLYVRGGAQLMYFFAAVMPELTVTARCKLL